MVTTTRKTSQAGRAKSDSRKRGTNFSLKEALLLEEASKKVRDVGDIIAEISNMFYECATEINCVAYRRKKGEVDTEEINKGCNRLTYRSLRLCELLSNLYKKLGVITESKEKMRKIK